MQPTVFGPLASKILSKKGYLHTKPSGHLESWEEVARRQAHFVLQPYIPSAVDSTEMFIRNRKLVPGGRYLYAVGRPFPQTSNCFMFEASDSREGPNGWGETMNKCVQALMTGGGIGVVYSNLRAEECEITGLGGKSTGPLALMNMVNEAARYIIQGGSRRSAVWAGLHWAHPDIFKFIHMKRWSKEIRELKKKDFSFPAPMDGTNMSVILDTAFFSAFSDPSFSKTYKFGDGSRVAPHTVGHSWARRVYWEATASMLETAEPGFSIDFGDNDGEHLRNACTEATSRDDGDNCNLASINMARFGGGKGWERSERSALEEFREAVEAGTKFLLCGTLYGRLPLPKMYEVRERNRRLGLGLMGVHEWMLRRDFKYGHPDCLKALELWMEAYVESQAVAFEWADRLGISRPVATRSIAPTGTISIIAETTSGIEPLFCAAYKRRYLDSTVWKAQYNVDVSAKRMAEEGLDPDTIEDAMTLSEDIGRRIAFQSWMQQYVDQGISSTLNLPEWGSRLNNHNTVEDFGNTLYPHLTSLRGITAYPDGCRDGQPLTRAPYSEAIKHLGVEFVDGSEQGCKNGVCGA